MRIALATSRELPDLDSDDHAYVKALRARGATVTLPIWNDEAAVFDADVTVIRSTWDYSEHKDEFVAWAKRISSTTKLLNPAALVDWNTDKQRYLSDLEQKRLPTVPTAWLARGASVDVDAVIRERGWQGVVIKPVVGAGSRDTVHIAADDVHAQAQAFVDAQLPKQALMVQPFLPKIGLGEVSLIFIDGHHSHAVIKKPKAGDFRSQPEFGSQIDKHTPTTTERDLADFALASIPRGNRPLYARVDLVTGLDDKPAIMELEMVEPCLYLGWSEHAADALAEATLRR